MQCLFTLRRCKGARPADAVEQGAQGTLVGHDCALALLSALVRRLVQRLEQVRVGGALQQRLRLGDLRSAQASVAARASYMSIRPA